jgi:molybdopterin/thiamine biosynthesis adenylyltransferase
MQIKIIGLGGIGSSLTSFVARYISFLNQDEHTIMLIDGDRYTENNASRQVFSSLGGKALITVERMNEEEYCGSNIYFESVTEYITLDNIEFYIEDSDIILLAVDNHKTRKIVSDFCVGLNDITLISGGNDLEDGNVLVYIKRDGKEITPPITYLHPEIENPEDKLPTELSCKEQMVSEPQIFFANLEAAITMCTDLRLVLTIEDITKFPYSETYFDINTGCKRSVMRKR